MAKRVVRWAAVALGVAAMAGVATATVGGCDRKPDDAAGRRSVERAARLADEGKGAIDRLVTGLQATIVRAAPAMATAMVAPLDEGRVRNAVRDLGDAQTEVGRELSLYPANFRVAIDPSGHAKARDAAAADDRMMGMDMAALFPCVRAALQGTAGTCVGEMPVAEGHPTRVYVLAVAPVRGESGVLGALAAGMSFGKLAQAVRGALDQRVASERAQVVVGILRGDRLLPSGRDSDVVERFLVPDAIVRLTPANRAARLQQGNGRFSFTFAQNDGRQQWGAAAAAAPPLGSDAAVLVYHTVVHR